MGLDALVAALERDADIAGQAVLAAAAQEAIALRQAVDERIAHDRDRRRREADQAHAVADGARVSLATRAARLAVLEAEHAWLEGLRAEVEAILLALPTTRWSGSIPALVGNALRFAGPGPVTLRCIPEAEDQVWATAGARPETTVTGVAGMEPGVLLTRDDGRLAVPLTLRYRLAVRWPELRLNVLARLEEEP